MGQQKQTMGKAKQRNIPWLEIKADYLQRIPPRDLSVKYNVSVKTISDRAVKEKWTAEKEQMCANVRINVEQSINEGATESLNYLRSVVNDPNEKTNDRIAAAKGILEVSGLKKSKTELTGKDGAPLAIQKEYILPEEIIEFEEHYNKSMGD